MTFPFWALLVIVILLVYQSFMLMRTAQRLATLASALNTMSARMSTSSAPDASRNTATTGTPG